MFYVFAILALTLWLGAASFVVASRINAVLSFAQVMVLLPALLAYLSFFAAITLPGRTAISWPLLVLPFTALVASSRGSRLGQVRGKQPRWRVVLSEPIVLCLLVFGFAAYYVGVLFVHAPGAGPTATAAKRLAGFSSDNQIPQVFAEAVRSGTIPIPLLGDWNSADRPPLQTGFILLVEPLLRPMPGYYPEAGYQISGVLFQLLWIPATWGLVSLLTRTRAAVVVAVCAVGFTGSTFTNSTYVWPKLAAAALGVVAFSQVLSATTKVASRFDWARWCLAGLSSGLAMLAHGTVAFALIGLVPCVVITLWWMGAGSRLSRLSRISLGLLLWGGTAVVLYLPWSAYALMRDERSDRLLKWSLAGEPSITDSSTVTAIVNAYSDLSLGAWISGRLDNLQALLPHLFVPPDATARWVSELHTNEAYSLMGALVWLVPWLVAEGVLHRVRPASGLAGERSNRTSLILVWWGSTLLAWILLLYIPGSTTMNAGPLTLVQVPLATVSVLVASKRPSMAIWLVGVQAALFTVSTFSPSAGSSVAALSWVAVSAIAFGLLVIGAALASTVIPRHPQAVVEERGLSSALR